MEWTDFLACPQCCRELKQVKETLFCGHCTLESKSYFITPDNIANLLCYPNNKREYQFEVCRYNKIACRLPEQYHGHDASKPDVRAEILRDLIQNQPLYLNIGPGFGSLEKLMPRQTKVCLDQSIEFLRVLQQEQLPNMWLVNAFAERLPFKNDYFPCVVSDSVWTVAVDQREFFIENVRVLKPGGTLIIAINYRWNYPRKPQDFPVDDPSLLKRFLDELGVTSSVEYYDLNVTFYPQSNFNDGQYQVIMGVKR